MLEPHRIYCVRGSWKAHALPFPKFIFGGYLKIYDDGFLNGQMLDRGGRSSVIGMLRGERLGFQKIYLKRGSYFQVEHELFMDGGNGRFFGTMEYCGVFGNSTADVACSFTEMKIDERGLPEPDISNFYPNKVMESRISSKSSYLGR